MSFSVFLSLCFSLLHFVAFHVRIVWRPTWIRAAIQISPESCRVARFVFFTATCAYFRCWSWTILYRTRFVVWFQGVMGSLPTQSWVSQLEIGLVWMLSEHSFKYWGDRNSSSGGSDNERRSWSCAVEQVDRSIVRGVQDWTQKTLVEAAIDTSSVSDSFVTFPDPDVKSFVFEEENFEKDVS